MNSEFPEIGKWLLDRNKKPSLWLNRKLDGKIIWEPINIIIRDTISKSIKESKRLLNVSLFKSGFKIRWGHITPRYANIGGIIYEFLPGIYFHAYSDSIWLKENNHGRFFGPHFQNDIYYYCGAVSRETAITHKYISFSLARNQFIKMLTEKSGTRFIKYFEMDNIIMNDTETTGDHDGKAILLEF
jgi:hypothetical protein